MPHPLDSYEKETASDVPAREPAHSVLRMILITLASLGVLAVGIVGFLYLYQNKPKSKRRPPKHDGDIVRVIQVNRTSYPITIQEMGTVLPARQVLLRPRVSGEVVAVGPEWLPGGLFRRGQTMLRIDPVDYELLIEQRRGAWARARYDLTLERARQVIAKREFELLRGEDDGVDQDEDMVLRRPHLALAEQAMKTAQASLKKAQVDLERTNLVASFNAMVLDKRVDPGMPVTPQTPLATLVGTDAYWVQVSIPVSQLKWITLPRNSTQPGSAAVVSHATAWPTGASRRGYVTRLAGDIDPKGRMARLLVTVEDPLALTTSAQGLPTMLIGMYVRVEIAGRTLENVFALPRRALRDGRDVWVMGSDKTLEIRRVELVWRGRDVVLVRKGLEDGERVITSGLAAPVQGMPLQVEKIKPSPSTQKSTSTSRPEVSE